MDSDVCGVLQSPMVMQFLLRGAGYCYQMLLFQKELCVSRTQCVLTTQSKEMVSLLPDNYCDNKHCVVFLSTFFFGVESYCQCKSTSKSCYQVINCCVLFATLENYTLLATTLQVVIFTCSVCSWMES